MKDHLPLAELKRLVRAEKNANWAKRLRIVILGVEGWTAPVAAMAVGSPRRICQRWVRPDNEEGMDVQRILVEEFHVFRALSSVYGLLHRRGSSYLRPRPRQRKADPEKQAAILAAWPERLRAIGSPSNNRRLSSGSKLWAYRERGHIDFVRRFIEVRPSTDEGRGMVASPRMGQSNRPSSTPFGSIVVIVWSGVT